MSSYTLNLTKKLYQYILDASLRESKILEELRYETAKLPSARMQISPEQGQFMALLIELISAKKTLDIGVYTGYSALAVALALPSDGRVVACDIDAKITQTAKEFWKKAGVENKIDLHIAPAQQTLEALISNGEANTFDFGFIDADKSNYENYYELALQLLRPGGLIMIDNTLWGGDVIDPNINDNATRAIRAINEKLHHDNRITLSMIPLGDGVTLARKKINSSKDSPYF